MSAGVGRVQHTGDYYGVLRFQMEEYLQRLGGRATEGGGFVGAGWSATLQPAPWKQVGSLRVGGTSLSLLAEADTLEALLIRLHSMTLRGGG